MPKFAIVEFASDNTIAVVSTSWLFDNDDQTYCRCPPMSQLSKAAEKCTAALTTWKVYECRLLYCTDDYAKARLKLRDAELTSNLESEVEAVGDERSKRKLCPNQYYSDSEPSLSVPSVSPRNTQAPAATKTGTTKTTKFCAPEPPSAPPPPPPASTMTPVRASPTQPIPRTQSPQVQTTPSPTLHTFPMTPRTSMHQSDSTTDGTVSAFERCVLTKLTELQQSMSDIKKGMGFLSSKVDFLMQANGLAGSNGDLPGDIEFPLQTIEKLNELLKKLENSQLTLLLIRNLSTIGGSSVKECTRRILRHVFTNGVAKKLNWKGRNGKEAFSEMALHSVIKSVVRLGAVRMNPLTSKATDCEIEKETKDWLKFATERDGRRRDRAQKQRSTSQKTRAKHTESSVDRSSPPRHTHRKSTAKRILRDSSVESSVEPSSPVRHSQSKCSRKKVRKTKRTFSESSAESSVGLSLPILSKPSTSSESLAEEPQPVESAEDLVHFC